MEGTEGKQFFKRPKSIRYCMACEKKTRFIYDEGTGHSRCVECGGWVARREEPGNKDG